MIFDSHRHLLSDYGAYSMLSDMPEVEINSNRFEMKLTFRFKQPMNNAPLVRPIDPGLYMDRFERGVGCDWVVWLRAAPTTIFNLPNAAPDVATLQISGIDANRPYRLLVEMLH